MPQSTVSVREQRYGPFDIIGSALNTVGHTVALAEELSIAGHTFTAGLPELAEQSSDLMNAKAAQALAEQRKLTAPTAKK